MVWWDWLRAGPLRKTLEVSCFFPVFILPSHVFLFVARPARKTTTLRIIWELALGGAVVFGVQVLIVELGSRAGLRL